MITLKISCSEELFEQCNADLMAANPEVISINHEQNNHTLMTRLDYNEKGDLRR
jgi:hypothetical protein